MTITRLKKGSKVEVLNRKETPTGMWCPAEIVSGNGHTYLVKYYRYPANIVERVSRKGIRPSPPSVVGPRPWVPGDDVEVLDDYSWKIAQLSGVVGGGYYDVMLLGSLTEFRAHSSDIRVRQSWQNNKWVVISKGSRELTGGTPNKVCKDGKFISQNDGFVMSEYDDVSSMFLTKGTRKRPRTFLPPLGTCMGASRKTRAIEIGGRHHGLDAESSTLFHEKVDAVASPQNMLGEKYMHASLNKRTTQFPEIQRLEGITADDNCHNSASLEPIDTESVSSSVGSCSLRDGPYRLSHYLVNGLTEDVSSSSHDCEISSHSGTDLSLPTKEAVEEEMHCIELHAYRKTMQAFYASGPISWEQEALMTNMRIMLHVSNDEHLTELRKFISAERNFRLL